MNRSEPEIESDNTQSLTLRDETRPTSSHSYNLRLRSEVTPADTQEK